jgi:hypothetical protein
MVMEVYTGARPGRPRIIFLLAAGLLVGMLALAWAQVRGTRALGPEQRVGQLPLYVRLPLKWRGVPDHPQTYELAVEGRGQRRIEFGYRRAPAYQSVLSVLRLLRLGESALAPEVRPARIGRYDGVEVHYMEVRRQWRRYVKERERLVRFATLPNGQLLYAIYEPLVDLRPADEEIFDDVCRTIRTDDPLLSGTADAHLSRAGLKLPLEPDWLVVGPDYDVPGVYLGGTEDHLPAWALGIFRTWLSAGRTPRDLLADFAAEYWRQWDPPPEIQSVPRPDGVTLLTMRNPHFGRTEEPIQAVWIASRAPDLTALIYVQAGAANAELADGVARRIALDLELQPVGEFATLAEPEQAGQALAAQLRTAGPVARWGREPVATDYGGHDALSTLNVSVLRRAIQRNPERGYEGIFRIWRGGTRNGAPDEEQEWRVDARAGVYDVKTSFLLAGVPVKTREQRLTPDGDVTRQVVVRNQEQTWRYRAGPAFVPPPLEPVVCGWVARAEAPSAISEWSAPVGPGTYTALLRQLPADGRFPRVLVQVDYWPIGHVEAYDDDQAELVYQLYPAGELRRVTEDGPSQPPDP